MKISKLAAVLLAALAVLVTGASAAQAANFTAAEETAFISGEQTGAKGTGGGGGIGATIFGFESSQMAECESAGKVFADGQGALQTLRAILCGIQNSCGCGWIRVPSANSLADRGCSKRSINQCGFGECSRECLRSGL